MALYAGCSAYVGARAQSAAFLLSFVTQKLAVRFLPKTLLTRQEVEKQGVENLGVENLGVENLGVENVRQLSTKESSTYEANTNESSTNKKKERKRTGYDEIIASYTDNGELRSALVEFVKMRKMMKKPLTNKALSLLLTSKTRLTSFY